MQKFKLVATGVVTAALLAGTGPAQALSGQDATGAVAAKASSKLKILKEFDYSRSKSRTLPLRQGEYYRNSKGKMVGFGWTKIKKRHNITKYGIIGWLAKSPNIASQGNQRYGLTGFAHHIKCKSGSCKIVDRRKMILVTDETATPVGEGPRFAYFGAVTSFCYDTKKTLKCPTWVNTKFKIPKSATADVQALNSGTARNGERYVFTYQPVKTVKGALTLAS
ncbi:hypothetical protein [Streptomyces ossamyceticus]|uniref:hypothetical protein n=1 Tax=Streptomyces ossamyceticus TaxID=249581 RepID=UPI0006E2C7D6|nr:hypothetical protein [Streptomyces ossamyceticus]